MEKDAKIYVAGHRGMVGSAIVRALKKQGYANILMRTSKELDLRRQDRVEAFFVAEKPDYVFSGINYGYNSGTDIQYSATVGSALEAACAGVHAIAFSEGASECHEVTDAYLEQMLKELMEQPLAHNQIWNVNFPQCELEKLRGILYDRKIADCGFFIDEYLEEGLENGRIRLTVHGNYNENAPEGTDFRALVDGYISVGKVNNLQ